MALNTFKCNCLIPLHFKKLNITHDYFLLTDFSTKHIKAPGCVGPGTTAQPDHF